MILAPTPRERERWYAILILAQAFAAATAEASTLSDDLAFGEGGPEARIFEQTGGSPRPRRGRASGAERGGAQPPAASGIGLANWNWKVVREFVFERVGIDS